jgi:hypothetical protein
MKFSISSITIVLSVLSSAAAQELVSRGGLKNFRENQVEAFEHAVGDIGAGKSKVSLIEHRTTVTVIYFHHSTHSLRSEHSFKHDLGVNVSLMQSRIVGFTWCMVFHCSYFMLLYS